MTMSESYALQIWNNLRFAIEEIQKKNNGSLSFEELYRNAYNLVLHRHGDMLYKGLWEIVAHHLSTTVREKLLQALVAETWNSQKFLSAVVSEWTDHRNAMNMIRDILMYMDRVYVCQAQGAYHVNDLGLILFRDKVMNIAAIKQSFRTATIDVFTETRQQQHRSEPFHESTRVFKQIWEMLESMDGVNSNNYEEEFEKHFLAAQKQFYDTESQNKLSSSTCFEYVQFVESFMEHEFKICSQMLKPGTEAKIRCILLESLIATKYNQALEILSEGGLLSLVRDYRITEIQTIYRVFSQDENASLGMAVKLGECLSTEGQSVISEIDDQSVSFTDRAIEIGKLVALHKKYEKIQNESIGSNLDFSEKICAAFESLLNSANKIAELLAFYFNHHLTYKTMDKYPSIIKEGVFIFKYLNEKDTFERAYRAHLCRRLLKDSDVELEAQTIHDLEQENGLQYVRRLYQMIEDVRTSKGCLNSFRAESQELRDSQLSVKLIRNGIWPTMGDEPNCTIPPILNVSYQSFADIHAKRHTGRKLILIKTHSIVEMYYSPDKKQPKKYLVQGNAYQMSLLYLFQDSDSLGMDEVVERLSMTVDEIKILLANVRGLLSYDKQTKLVSINRAFRNKGFRVKLPVMQWPKSGETVIVSDSEQHMRMVLEERRVELDAGIMRIMKTGKMMAQDKLIEMVKDTIHQRFVPNKVFIIERIDALIERDYLRRSECEEKIISYVL